MRKILFYGVAQERVRGKPKIAHGPKRKRVVHAAETVYYCKVKLSKGGAL